MSKLDPKLEPKEGTKVPTGEEEPESRPGEQSNDLKAIYKKARENRNLVVRADEENNPDAEMVAKMVAETADEGEFENTSIESLSEAPRNNDDEEIPDPEYVETGKPTEEIEEEVVVEEVVEKVEKEKELPPEKESVKVKVKVDGVEYTVPSADIDAAGGVNQYQLNRASNQRFEKAATYSKALQKEKQDFAQQQLDIAAKGELPDKDALNEEAELKDYREKILDAALDGTQEDVDKLLLELVAKRKPAVQDSPGKPEASVSDRVVEEFETAYALDRAEANRLLLDDYPDIMDNEDLRKIAHSKYSELSSDPDSFGRTAVEMARESGDFVRRIANSEPSKSETQEHELEVRREKKRVLPQVSQARSKSTPPETKKPRSNREYIRDLQRKQGSRS